jgi:hypothetical protein
MSPPDGYRYQTGLIRGELSARSTASTPTCTPARNSSRSLRVIVNMPTAAFSSRTAICAADD